MTRYDELTQRTGVAQFLNRYPGPRLPEVMTHLTSFSRWASTKTGASWSEINWFQFNRVPGTNLCKPIRGFNLTEFFLSWQQQRARSPYIHNRMLRILKDFFAFEVRHKRLDLSPAESFQPLPWQNRKKPVLTRVEVMRLLEAAAESPLDYSLVLVQLGMGLRPHELVRLTEADLRFDLAQAMIRGGKGRDSVQVMGEAVRQVLQEDWMCTAWRLETLKGISDARLRPVFCRGPSDPRTMRSEDVNQRFKSLLEKASIKKSDVELYTLRRTFAILLNDAGTHPAILQQLMRHKNITTLIKYLRHGNRTKMVTDASIAAWIDDVWVPGFRLSLSHDYPR